MAPPPPPPHRIHAPISIGELIDKITILEIKSERIGAPEKKASVAKELALLRRTKDEAGLNGAEIEALSHELRAINAALWDIEDAIRELEAKGDFGPAFVAAARSVYTTNDRRARIKHRIDILCGSDIVEQKSYRGM
jgi:hypothetical protein